MFIIMQQYRLFLSNKLIIKSLNLMKKLNFHLLQNVLQNLNKKKIYIIFILKIF